MDFYDSDLELLNDDIATTCLDFDIFPLSEDRHNSGPKHLTPSVLPQHQPHQQYLSLNAPASDEYLLDFLLDSGDEVVVCNGNDDKHSISSFVERNFDEAAPSTPPPPTFVSTGTQCNNIGHIPLVLPPADLPCSNFYYNTSDLLFSSQDHSGRRRPTRRLPAIQRFRIPSTNDLPPAPNDGDDDILLPANDNFNVDEEMSSSPPPSPSSLAPVLLSTINSDGLYLCRQVHEERFRNGQQEMFSLKMSQLVSEILRGQLKHFKRKLKRQQQKMFGELGEPKRSLVSAMCMWSEAFI